MIYLTDARRHLRIDGTEHDAEIEQKLLVANAMILAYVGHLRGDPWPENTFDELYNELGNADSLRFRHGDALDAARLLVLGDLWQSRESGSGNPLSPAVKNVLTLFREPGYA